jgi:acyl-homoserine-lactone acylase
MAGGQSGDFRSPHFADQVARYADGRLRSVYFYDDDLKSHVERRYHPGE